MKIEDVIFPLNRPEYPKIPELFQSSLAWGIARSTGLAHTRLTSDGEKKEGLVFQKIQESTGKTISIRETFPSSDYGLLAWEDRLSDAGFAVQNGKIGVELAASLLESIEAIRPVKSKASSTVPVVPAASYLQDPVGLHAKANPPNFYEIIEQIYRLGSPVGHTGLGAAACWYSAITSSEEQVFFDRFSKALENWVVSDLRLVESMPSKNALPETTYTPPVWLAKADTPFSWFHQAWLSFCDPAWRSALPRRRWSDWASCLLRTGIGLAYLWESWFYQSLGRLLLDPATSAERAKVLLTNPDPLLEWRVDDIGLASRDVNTRIRRLVADGLACRDILSRIVEENSHNAPDKANAPGGVWHGEDGLEKFVIWLSGVLTIAQREEIAEAFGNNPVGGAKNTIETITFSLQTRKELGSEADYYGLLARRSRRFLVVNPGLEWIVVIASMTAGLPRSETTLGKLKRDLKKMGLGFPRNRLVSELERVGLSRSSHDADDAIVVRTGF